MLCCGKKMILSQRVALQDIGMYEERELRIYTCPICYCTKYQLIEYDVVENEVVYDRCKPSKKKNIPEWANSLIKMSRAFAYFEEIKTGNKSNMGFIYGVNTSKEQKGYDFNGTLRCKYEKSLCT